MRAREFVRKNLKEQTALPPELADPMRYTYIIPGLSAADPYKNYRFGVAMARARSDYADSTSEQNKSIDPYKKAWSAETVFGEHGVQYQRGLRMAIAQEEAAMKAAADMARLGAAIELATEPRLADLEEELARVRARGLNLSECVRRWTALLARRSILTSYYADR